MGVGGWRMEDGECGEYITYHSPSSILHPLSPIPYFALTGNSRSKTNSIMISVRATAEVFAAK